LIPIGWSWVLGKDGTQANQYIMYYMDSTSLQTLLLIAVTVRNLVKHQSVTSVHCQTAHIPVHNIWSRMSNYPEKDHPRVVEATARHRTIKITVPVMKKEERVLKTRGITVILNKVVYSMSLMQVQIL
jgi:hypothetical protein